MNIEQFQTRYEQEEDRLRLDGQNAQGVIVTLWLTQRLIRRLVPPLVKLITPASGTPAASKVAEMQLANARVRQATQKPSPTFLQPVVGTVPPHSFLVRTINVTPAERQARLDFIGVSQSQQVTINFPPDALRQWLGVLCKHWHAAGWPASDWPDWVRNAELPTTAGDAVIH